MDTREICKASSRQIKGFIMVNALFVFWLVIVALVGRKFGEDLGILMSSVYCSIMTFLFSLIAYFDIFHDAVFKNVKTTKACIYKFEKKWRLLEIFLDKEGKGKEPLEGFKVWVQGVDDRGNINPIEDREIQVYEYPVELELKSTNFDLYYEIEKLSKKHTKVKNYGEEAEEFLYGEITYVEKSKLIVGFKYLGTKKYA